MKKLLLGLLVAFSVFAVCAQHASAKEVHIGAAMSSFADTGQTYLQDGIRKFDAEHDDVTVTMTDGKDDPAVQLNQVETLIIKGVDALIVVPIDPAAMAPIIELAKDANIPIITANRLAPDDLQKMIDVYVGSESVQAGIMQGEWIASHLKGPSKAGIIRGTSGQEAAEQRTIGVKEVFGESVPVVAEAEGRWDRAKGQDIAENWMQTGLGINILACNNDEMAIGAVLAAQANGLKDEDIIIAGVDATKEGLSYLGKGLDVTIYQDMFQQGYASAEAAYGLVNGQELDKVLWIPFQVVTVGNKAQFLKMYEK